MWCLAGGTAEPGEQEQPTAGLEETPGERDTGMSLQGRPPTEYKLYCCINHKHKSYQAYANSINHVHMHLAACE